MCSESTVRAIFRAYGHFPSVYQAPASPLPVHPHRKPQHPRRGKPSTARQTTHHAASQFTQTPEYGHSAVPRGGTLTAPWNNNHAVEVCHTINLPPRGKPSTTRQTDLRKPRNTAIPQHHAVERLPRRGTLTAPWKDYRAVEGLSHDQTPITRQTFHRTQNAPPRGKPPTAHETPHRAASRFTQTPEYGHSAVPRGGTFTAPWNNNHAVEGLPRGGGVTCHGTRPRGTVGKITVPWPCRLDVIWVSLLQLIGLDQPRAQGAPAVYEQRSLV